MQWILSASGRWHAWPVGGRRTVCNRINVEHLRIHPAKEINSTGPTDVGEKCVTCVKKAGLCLAPPNADPVIAAWMVHLRLRFKRRPMINVPEYAVQSLAELLAELGMPNSPKAVAAFTQVEQFLLKPTWQQNRASLPHLKAVLPKFPRNSGALERVADTVRVWTEVTKSSLSTENFVPERALDVILQIPAPEPYIRHLHARGLTYFAAMFHPNTFARTKKEPTLRGLFAGSTSYWDNTAAQLNIVHD